MIRVDSAIRETPRRTLLRSVVATKRVLHVGEPARVRVKVRKNAPDDLIARVDGALGFERYVSFAAPGLHKVPVVVGSRRGALERTEIEFEVVAPLGPRQFPILETRQEPTNP